MTRPAVTVTIITLNEEHHLPRAIESVRWADEIIVVDSGSTDNTQKIAGELGAKVWMNPWLGYGKQKNFAQQKASNDWVFNVDADEEVSPELQVEIFNWLDRIGNNRVDWKGFSIPRKTFYLGRWIQHGGWYPNYQLRLAHRQCSYWTEPSVHEELIVEGKTTELSAPLFHYTVSNIQDQVLKNVHFSKLGSQELARKGKRGDILHLIFKPFGKFIEVYFLKKGFLDGLPGFIIAINAAHSMFLKYAYLIEANIPSENTHR